MSGAELRRRWLVAVTWPDVARRHSAPETSVLERNEHANRHREGRAAFTSAIELKPTSADAASSYAHFLANLGELDEAEAMLITGLHHAFSRESQLRAYGHFLANRRHNLTADVIGSPR